MKHHTIKKILFSLAAATALSIIPLSAAAQPAGTGGPSGGLRQIDNPDVNPTNIQVGNQDDVLQLIAKIISWALYVAGAIAVLFVIIGGYRYLVSAGNEEAAKKGRQTVVNALIGLVIIILAYVIVNAVANFLTT